MGSQRTVRTENGKGHAAGRGFFLFPRFRQLPGPLGRLTIGSPRLPSARLCRAAMRCYRRAHWMVPSRFVPLYEMYNVAEERGDTAASRAIAREILAKPVKVPSRETLEMIGPYFARLERHLGQMKKYQVTIDYLTQENMGLKQKVNDEKSIQKRVEVLELKKENERLRRFVESIPQEIRQAFQERQREQSAKAPQR